MWYHGAWWAGVSLGSPDELIIIIIIIIIITVIIIIEFVAQVCRMTSDTIR